MFEYSLDVHEEPGSVWLTCAAIPEMHAVGDTQGEALATAIDAIETAFSIYVDDRRLIPTAHTEEQENGVVLRLPALTAAKVAFWNSLLESGVSKAELARRLGVQRPQVDRLVDFLHHSKIEGEKQGQKNRSDHDCEKQAQTTIVRPRFSILNLKRGLTPIPLLKQRLSFRAS